MGANVVGTPVKLAYEKSWGVTSAIFNLRANVLLIAAIAFESSFKAVANSLRVSNAPGAPSIRLSIEVVISAETLLESSTLGAPVKELYAKFWAVWFAWIYVASITLVISAESRPALAKNDLKSETISWSPTLAPCVNVIVLLLDFV